MFVGCVVLVCVLLFVLFWNVFVLCVNVLCYLCFLAFVFFVACVVVVFPFLCVMCPRVVNSLRFLEIRSSFIL